MMVVVETQFGDKTCCSDFISNLGQQLSTDITDDDAVLAARSS